MDVPPGVYERVSAGARGGRALGEAMKPSPKVINRYLRRPTRTACIRYGSAHYKLTTESDNWTSHRKFEQVSLLTK